MGSASSALRFDHNTSDTKRIRLADLNGKHFQIAYGPANSVCVSDGACEFRTTLTQEQRNGVIFEDPVDWIKIPEFQQVIISKYACLIGAKIGNSPEHNELNTTITSVVFCKKKGKEESHVQVHTLDNKGVLERSRLMVNRSLCIQRSVLLSAALTTYGLFGDLPRPLLHIIVSYVTFPTLSVVENRWVCVLQWFGGDAVPIIDADVSMLGKTREHDSMPADDVYCRPLLSFYADKKTDHVSTE